MFIIRIWNYFCGYAIIIVEGLKIERFLNLIVVNNIYIWDIEKINYTTIRAKINVKDFKRLREVVRKTDSSVKIIEKSGIPFTIKKIKRRKFVYIGLVLLCIFLYWMTTYIWMIDIGGTKTVSENKIIQVLTEEGLKIGSPKSKLNYRTIENRLLIRMPELAWAGIEVKGTRAFVEVVEKKEEPEIISREDACNIVAAKDAVIDKILILNGDGAAKDGDTVKRGQLLVTGIIVRQNMPIRYVHSMAQVNARTWYEEVEEIPLKQIEYKKTGKVATKYNIRIVNKDLFRNKAIKFKDYNEYQDEINIFAFGNYVFPVKLIKCRYEELTANVKSISVEQAKQRCAERLNMRIKLQIPEDAQIVNKKIDYYISKDSVKAKMSVEVREDIGVKQKINK